MRAILALNQRESSTVVTTHYNGGGATYPLGVGRVCGLDIPSPPIIANGEGTPSCLMIRHLPADASCHVHQLPCVHGPRCTERRRKYSVCDSCAVRLIQERR